MRNTLEESLKNKIEGLLVKNRKTFGSYQYTVPSPTSYPYQWLWDSCFHAIMLTNFNNEDAKKELLSVVSKQFDNGLIPHMIYWEKGELHDIDWGKTDTSTITQPPMLAYAVWKVFLKDQDEEFLKQIYPSLKKYTQYLLSQRDPRGNNLIGIINPDESGEDNSPRFDAALGMSPKHTLPENFKRRLQLVKDNKACNFDAPFCMKNFFWVKDVPFNAIMVEHLFCMANIASRLELKEDSTHFAHHSNLIKDAMKQFMFEDGVYWSTFGADYKKIKVLTWAIFAPLFAKIYSKEEAYDVVYKHLLNQEEFNLKYIVPTVAKSEDSYDPTGFWRGPVWASTNWFVYQGLINYGFDEIAQKVYQSTHELIDQSGFREYFNPDTGEGLGATDFTWGGLILDMQPLE